MRDNGGGWVGDLNRLKQGFKEGGLMEKLKPRRSTFIEDPDAWGGDRGEMKKSNFHFQLGKGGGAGPQKRPISSSTNG